MTFFFLKGVCWRTFINGIFLSNLYFKRYCSDIKPQWNRSAISVCLFFLPTERGRERSEPPWRLEIPYPHQSMHPAHFHTMSLHLHHYFNQHVCLSICTASSSVTKNFFRLNRLGITPWGWPRVAPGHTAPPEELAKAQRAFSSLFK